MKLYGAPNPAPSPRRVRIAIAEKGIDLAETPVDLRARAHKAPEHLALNPAGQVPTLVLGDGRTLSESVAICRYLDALHPAPPLFGGADAFAVAEIDQWIRRVELMLMLPVAGFWRHAHPFTASLLTQYKDYGESNRAATASAMRWFDRQLAGRASLGDGFSMADICLLTTVDFAAWIGLPMPEECTNLRAWHTAISARPSAAA
ncbi:glutathione S-transferase [alpha proteobacterium AAP81b]|nr:glutathione S-transferase [alpha proteobacterium AAP81b]